jgi:hypothetical protein
LVGCDKAKVDDLEQEVLRRGLSADREASRVWQIKNPKGKGVCVRKLSPKPLIEVMEDGDIVSRNTELCGPIATLETVKAGYTVALSYRYVPLHYLFAEKLKDDIPDLKLEAGEYMCIGVEKLSHLPEYKTTGPWFLIPGCIPE